MGYKNTFSYNKLLQILIWQGIKDDNTAFVLGGTYELSRKMGLLEKSFIQELKQDGTYNEATFEREYNSLWGGASEDSFFNGDNIDKARTLKQPTLNSEMKNNPKIGAYYIVSADVGRLGCDTVACVFKVYPGSNGASLKHLVYMEVYSEEHFEIQAFNLKELVDKYNARVLVVDANGNGVGLVDFLVLESYNISRTQKHPPYSVVNDDRYNKFKTSESKPLLYNIKGNSDLNNEIAVNVASQFASGKIKLLIDERVAKSNLTVFEEKHNKSYSSPERAKILKQYILTSNLKEELLNLKSKLTENKKSITLIRDNNKIEKDKYSAFSYGLYWIKLEDESKISKKRLSTFKDFMMYTKNVR